ncbi:MAG: tRNA (adenosine(37)-N6)-dimethylallyltransferase MiaA [Syntrophaceae bacterium]|nr:tRNA (adenosine(37)-N6)-dimethylallyltransferase MiaA [Syntrophaceae bacterium]
MDSSDKKNLIVILGPTASGKTTLAVKLATEIDGEIISADSRQVYRGMDLGTGKDLSEYASERKDIPYHLIDIVDPSEEFNLFQFQRRFVACFNEITGRGKMPVLVGGTGMYLESVILNYRLPEVRNDQELRIKLADLDMDALIQIYLSESESVPHNKTDMTDRNRLIRAIEINRQNRKDFEGPEQEVLRRISPIIIGVKWARSILRQRITTRLKARLDAGLIEEVQKLRKRGLSWERLDSFGLEYRYISRYLQGQLNYENMFRELETKIHQFAKRQETWFRRMERKGVTIHWVIGDDYAGLRQLVHTAIS